MINWRNCERWFGVAKISKLRCFDTTRWKVGHSKFCANIRFCNILPYAFTSFYCICKKILEKSIFQGSTQNCLKMFNYSKFYFMRRKKRPFVGNFATVFLEYKVTLMPPSYDIIKIETIFANDTDTTKILLALQNLSFCNFVRIEDFLILQSTNWYFDNS